MKNRPTTAITLFEAGAGMAYSIEQVARITHTSRHTIAVYCRLGVIEPLDLPDRPGWHFDDEAIRTLSRAEHIRREHGVNLRGTAIILRLLDRIEALQDELRFLRGAR